MPRSTQVPVLSLSPSNTGLSPSVVELSSSLLLTTHESETPALQPRLNEFSRFRLIPVRSPLLRESRLISLPAGTEMFHFPAFACTDLCIQSGIVRHDSHWVAPFRDLGCPIQRSPDQRMFCSSPRLIAAYHVFHRLPTPRHPPDALVNLFSK